jgi:poly(3-hydroxybutyrate) depolymerase
MTSFRCARMMVAALAIVGAACSSSGSGPSGTGGSNIQGGTPMTGGSPGSGGALGTGGKLGTGGSPSTGGATDKGGQPGSGGTVAAGGTSPVAGQTGSGGGGIDGGAAGLDAATDSGGKGSGGTGGAGGGTAIDGGGNPGEAKPSAGCGKTPSLAKSAPPPNSKITYNKITSASLNRQYILWYPDNYDKNRPYRLIMNYHWYSGSASQVFDCSTEGINCYTTQSPFFGLMNLADNSTIFVAPDGIDAGWANTNNRDTTLTDDILKEVENDLCIDTNRVFAQGFSYGGAMSATLGCQRADVFRGVVVFAGGISGMSGACTGTTPIAYYGATGTQDSGYSGGQTAVQHFAQVNGCTTQTLPTPPTGGHTCISFAGCSAGHPVRWCPFDDIHTPSPRDKGASTTWQPKEVWTFLTQF